MGGKWSDNEKTQLAKALGVLALIQKSYGRTVDIKPTVMAWEWVMGDYAADSVITAMEAYMRQSSDMPAPADLIKIIDPPAPKISEYEYRQLYKQWELNGFPKFSYEHAQIEEYRKQNEIAQPREVYKVLNGPDAELNETKLLRSMNDA